MTTARKTAEVKNSDGIHCRPSTVIIKALMDYDGEVRVRGERGETSLNSVVGLMSLALLPGDNVMITVDGPHAEETARKAVELFETHFDFPPRPDGSQPFVKPGRNGSGS